MSADFFYTMSTSGEKALQAALEHLKVRNAEYLMNQNVRTDSNLSGAMGRQARALANMGGMAKQAAEMRKVEQDFGARDHRKKISIAHALANTLVRLKTNQYRHMHDRYLHICLLYTSPSPRD